MKQNLIAEKTFEFALSIIILVKTLDSKREFTISRQLGKCGTSIGANVQEAIAAQSRRDFISKMCIASKEARETKYWLRLLKESKICSNEIDHHCNEIENIINIITRIILTSKQRG